jgi:hypothetical protein
MGRIGGEFSPPRELVVLGTARMAGRGSVEVTSGGLALDGTIVGGSPPLPVWASLVVAVVGTAIAASVPAFQNPVMAVTILAVGGILWLRFRAEGGRHGIFRVPWAEVEHVVRLASNPDVVAFVFAHPIDGARSPDQVFFAATAGVDALVDELRADAPPSLTIDVESALLPSPEEPADQ